LCARARARRFLTNIATKVEIALITTIITIQSGSCSYIMQSPTTGNAVLFSIVTSVCVCVRAIYTDSRHSGQLDTFFSKTRHTFAKVSSLFFRHNGYFIRSCQFIIVYVYANSQLSTCNFSINSRLSMYNTVYHFASVSLCTKCLSVYDCQFAAVFTQCHFASVDASMDVARHQIVAVCQRIYAVCQQVTLIIIR